MFTKKLAGVPSGDSVKKARGRKTRKMKQKPNKQTRSLTNISRTWILIELKVQKSFRLTFVYLRIPVCKYRNLAWLNACLFIAQLLTVNAKWKHLGIIKLYTPKNRSND